MSLNTRISMKPPQVFPTESRLSWPKAFPEHALTEWYERVGHVNPPQATGHLDLKIPRPNSASVDRSSYSVRFSPLETSRTHVF